MIPENEMTCVSRTCFRHYAVLLKTRSTIATAISFLCQTDETGSPSREFLVYWKNSHSYSYWNLKVSNICDGRKIIISLKMLCPVAFILLNPTTFSSGIYLESQ